MKKLVDGSTLPGNVKGAHWWTSPPDRYCAKCGEPDFMEKCIKNGWYNPETNVWDTQEHKQLWISKLKCHDDSK